jgi:hypothetical protein
MWRSDYKQNLLTAEKPKAYNSKGRKVFAKHAEKSKSI